MAKPLKCANTSAAQTLNPRRSASASVTPANLLRLTTPFKGEFERLTVKRKNRARDAGLSDYLWSAWEKNQKSYESWDRCDPYRSPLWEFVREAKADSRLSCLGAFDAAEEVEQVIATWHADENEPGDVWERCFPDAEDAKSEFIDTWDRVKYPRPELEMALIAARSTPLFPARYVSVKYAEFIGVAGHLQRRVGDRSIFLPCHKLADLLDVDPTTISRFRRMAIAAGLLEVVARHKPGEGKADEFRFCCDLFDWKSGMQTRSANRKLLVTPGREEQCHTDTQDDSDSYDF